MESVLSILGHSEVVEKQIREEIAARARQAGIDLTDDHWAVIDYVRRVYADSDEEPSARDMSRDLERKFADKGGNKYLRSLFPEGPISQASELADLPPPRHARDPSFGVAY